MKKLSFISTRFFFLFCMFVITAEAAEMNKSVIVEVPTLRVRSGPGTNYKIISKVRLGEKFPVHNATSRGWYQIPLKSGEQGWVSGQHLKIMEGMNKSAIINATSLRVRSGPGTNYSIISTVDKGDKYTVFKTDNGWHKISLKDEKEGWVSGDYLKFPEADESVSYETSGQHLGTTTIPHCDGDRSCYAEIITPGATISHNIDNTQIDTNFKDTRINLACGYSIVIGRYKTYDQFPDTCPDPYYIIVQNSEKLENAEKEKVLSCIREEICLYSWDRFADNPVGQLRAEN
ncbi:MAG: SH3 domain-containing protein [Desulfobacterales bacterium]|nr:SH3 domain-containing protein [Desulfobacterales bacterium]